MTPEYEQELAGLADTYQAAIHADISTLKRAVAGASEESVIAVGSGGSFTVASLLCSLHEAYTGHVSRPSTPLEIICNPTLAASSPAFFVSAEGKNPDIIEALLRARLHSSRAIQVLTNQEKSPLTERISDLMDITVHLFPSERKDGFLATNSLLLDSVLIARTYRELDKTTVPLAGSMDELLSQSAIYSWLDGARPFAEDLARRGGLIIVYSPHLRSVAADLESKLSEAALVYCQSTDVRSFAHGRHLWLSERSADCAVLALVDTSLQLLWERMRDLLPATAPISTLSLSGSGPSDLLAGLIGGMHFVNEVAKALGKDAGKPQVTAAGRELHYLDYNQLISPPQLVDTRELEEKYCVLGASWPYSGSRGKLERACGEFRATLKGRSFRAIVFDYDGTLCRSQRGDAPPTETMIGQLRRLLDAQIAVGIASGRGGSVHEHLRRLLPPEYYPKIFLGLYSGGWLGTLEDTSPTGQTLGSSELLSHVTRIVGKLKEYGAPIESIRPTLPHQVSIRFREGVHSERMWFVIADGLKQAGLSAVNVVHSKHSVDVLEFGVDKSHLIARMIQECKIDPYEILALGDQGAWPGNDSSLLEHRFSLSVDTPSRQIDRGWKLAPAHKRDIDATLWYLDRLNLSSAGRFQLAI